MSGAASVHFWHLGLLAAPLAAEAQQAGRSIVSGILRDAPALTAARLDAFRQGLRELGYVEGKNIVIEYRWAKGDSSGCRPRAELVRLKVDLIVRRTSIYTGGQSERPRRSRSSRRPAIRLAGLVASLAQPGGNVTGLDDRQDVRLDAEELELLKGAIPGSLARGRCLGPGHPIASTSIEGREDTAGRWVSSFNRGGASTSRVRRRLFR